MERCMVIRGQGNEVPKLVHATTHQKAAAIQMVGFRIGPRTKRSTGYCDKDDWDCVRASSYEASEELLERVRVERRPELPSRRVSVFFGQEGNDFRSDEPEAFMVGEDDWGQPIYDFGYGKDVLFTVDPLHIPCRCGVGTTEQSDNVFGAIRERISGQKYHEDEALRRDAEKFWDNAGIYDPSTLYEMMDEEEGMLTTEVWCPCRIPPEAIVQKIGGKPHEY